MIEKEFPYMYLLMQVVYAHMLLTGVTGITDLKWPTTNNYQPEGRRLIIIGGGPFLNLKRRPKSCYYYYHLRELKLWDFGHVFFKCIYLPRQFIVATPNIYNDLVIQRFVKTERKKWY